MSDLLYFYPCFYPTFSHHRPAFPHLKSCVAIIHGVFDKEILENANSHLFDLRPLV